MKKALSMVLVLTMVLSVAAGCSSPAAPPEEEAKPDETVGTTPKFKEVTFATTVDATSLDPRNALGTDTAQILAHVFNSLVKTDENAVVSNDLIESYEIVDDVTWKFKLKDGITFHDGSQLTSADVEYTVSTIKDKEKNFSLAADFSFMTVKVIDDLNFEIITDEPFPGLLLRLNYMKIIPKAYVEKVGDEAFAQNPIGSGPYRFVERRKDERIVMEAYDNYFDGKPAIDRVTFRIIPEAASRIAALEAGEVDIISAVDSSQVGRLEAMDNIKVVSKATTRVMYIGMNLLQDGPLQDVRVRQAINYAVDKDILINGVLDGHATQIATISTPEYECYDPSILPYEYNPEKAKQLLAEAGYSNGFKTELVVSQRYIKGLDVCQVIAAQLAEVGIECVVSEIDHSTRRDKLSAGTIEPLYMAGLGGPYADIDMVALLGFNTGGRYSTYANPEFDTLRQKAASTIDSNERQKLYSQLQQYIKDEAPAIFLYQQHGIYAYNTRVVNWQPRVDEMLVLSGADIK
jgi:peptide/nickel transport system substrate-binding protein